MPCPSLTGNPGDSKLVGCMLLLPFPCGIPGGPDQKVFILSKQYGTKMCASAIWGLVCSMAQGCGG